MRTRKAIQQWQPISYAFFVWIYRKGLRSKKSSGVCSLVHNKTSCLPAWEELVSWVLGILGLKFQACESDPAALLQLQLSQNKENGHFNRIRMSRSVYE